MTYHSTVTPPDYPTFSSPTPSSALSSLHSSPDSVHFPSALTKPDFPNPSTSSTNSFEHRDFLEPLRTVSTVLYTEMKNPTQGLEGRDISDSRGQEAFEFAAPRCATRGTSLSEERATESFVGSTIGERPPESKGGNRDHEMEREYSETSEVEGKLFPSSSPSATGTGSSSNNMQNYSNLLRARTNSSSPSHHYAFNPSYGAPYPFGAISFPQAPRIPSNPAHYPKPSSSDASNGNSRFGEYIDGVTDVPLPFVYNNPNFPIANALAAARNANANKHPLPLLQSPQIYQNVPPRPHNTSSWSSVSERQEESFIGPLGEAESARREVRLASAKTGSGAGIFVYKLYAMLLDPSSRDIVSFTPGGRSFTVTNTIIFSSNVLPKHYKHNNFSSFIRQLNMYGFSKINKVPRNQSTSPNQSFALKDAESLVWEFAHPKFVKGQSGAIEQIKRKVNEDPNSTASPQSGRASTTQVRTRRSIGMSIQRPPPLASSTTISRNSSFDAEGAFSFQLPPSNPPYSSGSSVYPSPNTRYEPKLSPSLQSFPETPSYNYPYSSSGPQANFDRRPSDTKRRASSVRPPVGSESEPYRSSGVSQQAYDALYEEVLNLRQKQDVLVNLLGDLYGVLQRDHNVQLPYPLPIQIFADRDSRMSIPTTPLISVTTPDFSNQQHLPVSQSANFASYPSFPNYPHAPSTNFPQQFEFNPYPSRRTSSTPSDFGANNISPGSYTTSDLRPAPNASAIDTPLPVSPIPGYESFVRSSHHQPNLPIISPSPSMPLSNQLIGLGLNEMNEEREDGEMSAPPMSRAESYSGLDVEMGTSSLVGYAESN